MVSDRYYIYLKTKGVAHKLASKAPVFEKIYQDYLARVADLELAKKQDLMGIEVDGQTITIPVFNKPCFLKILWITRASVLPIRYVSFCASICN
jgi:hypothetical protein